MHHPPTASPGPGHGPRSTHGATTSQRSSDGGESTGARTTAPAQPIALWQQLGAVAAALQAIRAGQSGTAVLAAVDSGLRPGVQALLFQVLRQAGRAQALRRQLVSRAPPPAADALLCSALALCWDPAAACHAPFVLVDQAVEAARRSTGMRAQAGFINACLRRFLRERTALVAATDGDAQARWNHPPWWIERLRQDHPQHWQQMLLANGRQAPMTLRVNRQKCTLAQYVQALAALGMQATPLAGMGLVLHRPVPVQALPGFSRGLVSVQDAAAQLAAPLLLGGLDLSRPLRVLDACAAPGGKSAHLLELAGSGAPLQLTALEIDAARSARIGAGLQRLGLSAQILLGDATRPQDWWPQHCAGEPFDAILLDAPCSASGIVRRHPDVRWLRRAHDIARLAAQQARLLAALWPLLRPGGRLLYCSCSVFRAEGQELVQAFLAHNRAARLLPSPGHLIPGAADKGGAVPDNPGGDYDGFFYALLQKSPF